MNLLHAKIKFDFKVAKNSYEGAVACGWCNEDSILSGIIDDV